MNQTPLYMNLKLLLLFVGLSLLLVNCSPNIKKILTKEELNELETSNSLIKYISRQDIDELEGFTGNILVKRQNNKYKYIKIGNWSRSDSKYGPNALMVLDSMGRILEYTEFNKNNTIGKRSKYKYESRNEVLYCFEHQTVYDEDGIPAIIGSRYWTMTLDDFGFYQPNKKQKYGKWEYFDNQGYLIKTEDYGEIK